MPMRGLLTSPHVTGGMLAATLLSVAVAHALEEKALEAAQTAPEPWLEHAVFVTEGSASSQFVDLRGCAAFSVFDLRRPDPVYSGPRLRAYNRLSASRDFSTVVGSPHRSNKNFAILERDGNGWSSIEVRPPDGGRYSTVRQGTYLSPDGDHLYVAQRVGHYDTAIAKIPLTRPYTTRLSSPIVKLPTGRQPDPIQFLQGRHQETVHALMEDDRLLTFNRVTMEWEADSVQLAPIDMNRSEDSSEGRIMGTMSLGRRYVVSNRWNVPELNVTDVLERQSWTVPLGDDVALVGGVAVNHGWENRGLLAMHATNEVRVYRFDPGQRAPEPLEAIGRIKIPPPLEPLPTLHERAGQIAWSATGSHLIANVSHESGSEFVVIRVDRCGAVLAIEGMVQIRSERA